VDTIVYQTQRVHIKKRTLNKMIDPLGYCIEMQMHFGPLFPLFFFTLVLSLFFTYVVSSLAYPNLLETNAWLLLVLVVVDDQSCYICTPFVPK
jgi:hypothetical protein